MPLDIAPEWAIYDIWIGWYLTWILAAGWSGRTLKRPGASQVPFLFLELGGVFTLLSYISQGATVDGDLVAVMRRYWDFPLDAKWALVGLALLGFLFCWWARIHLGRLWSGAVTRKEGHRVVDTGPYAIVRHPIYFGVLTAALATMLLKGTGNAVIGFAMLLLNFSLKSAYEERFLRRELGNDAYDSYARRVPKLVPIVGV